MALFNLFGKKKGVTEATKEAVDTTATTPEAEAPTADTNTPDETTAEAAIEVAVEPVVEEQPAAPQQQPQEKPSGGGFFARIRQGLSRTRSQLGDGLASLFMGAKTIDEDLFEELETQLLMADVGVEATSVIMKELTDTVTRKDLKDPQALYAALRECLANLIQPCTAPL